MRVRFFCWKCLWIDNGFEPSGSSARMSFWQETQQFCVGETLAGATHAKKNQNCADAHPCQGTTSQQWMPSVVSWFAPVSGGRWPLQRNLGLLVPQAYGRFRTAMGPLGNVRTADGVLTLIQGWVLCWQTWMYRQVPSPEPNCT